MRILKNNLNALYTSLLALTLLCTGLPAAAADNGMLYLVEFRANDAGAPSSRAQAIELLDQLIIPSLNSLAKDKRIIAGGVQVGARAGAFIISASSHDEVTNIVRALPAWGVWDWTVTPLESFAHRAALEGDMLKQMREMK